MALANFLRLSTSPRRQKPAYPEFLVLTAGLSVDDAGVRIASLVAVMTQKNGTSRIVSQAAASRRSTSLSASIIYLLPLTVRENNRTLFSLRHYKVSGRE